MPVLISEEFQVHYFLSGNTQHMSDYTQTKMYKFIMI